MSDMFAMVPVEEIVVTYNPRQSFDEEEMQKLVASIREVGIVQPLLLNSINGGSGTNWWRGAADAVQELATPGEAVTVNLHVSVPRLKQVNHDG